MRRLGIFALERIVAASVGERLAQRAGTAVVCVDDCDGGCVRGDCYCAKQRHANCGTTYRYDSGVHVTSGRDQVLQNRAGLSQAKQKQNLGGIDWTTDDADDTWPSSPKQLRRLNSKEQMTVISCLRRLVKSYKPLPGRLGHLNN